MRDDALRQCTSCQSSRHTRSRARGVTGASVQLAHGSLSMYMPACERCTMPQCPLLPPNPAFQPSRQCSAAPPTITMRPRGVASP